MNLFNIIPFVFVISFINASQLKPLQRYTGMDDQTFHISLKDKYSIIAFQLTTFAGNTNIQDIFSDNEMTEQIQFTVYDSRRTVNYLIQDNTNMNFSFNVTCSDHCYYHLIVLIPQAGNYKLEKGYSNIISFRYGDDLLNYLNFIQNQRIFLSNCFFSSSIDKTLLKEMIMISFIIEKLLISIVIFLNGVSNIDTYN